jgi:uridine kinase
VKPVTLAESDGGRIYRRSLVLLMVTAANELWPDVHISVNHVIRDGGFYCELENREPFSEKELRELDARMREIVAADDPIEKRRVPLDDARDIFRQRNDQDKLRLLDYRDKDGLTLYSLRGHDDYYFGYMVPSSGYLSLFKLLHFDSAFVLQYPRKRNPHELREARLYPKLSAVFALADEWLEKLAIEDIGRLNYLVKSDGIREMILVAEALHEQNVAAIATELSQRHADGTRIVLIAGPTSSGKTTFAKRLSIQLLAHGLRPFTMEMDNYFVNRADTPLDDEGNYDFEAIEALNRDLLNEHLLRLMQGEEVQLRHYNFHTGEGEPGRVARLEERQIIILEGIHGLNPDLVPGVPDETIYRVYVSAMTQLNIDRHNRVPTTDVRLLRRIVRDARTRGYDATDTLERWTSVRRGEKRNVFPYQENADVMFNSALVYELAALRPMVEPLLLQVPYGIAAHLEANRLLSFLRWVKPLNEVQRGMIPDTSLLREFIGGLILDDYHPGA